MHCSQKTISPSNSSWISLKWAGVGFTAAAPVLGWFARQSNKNIPQAVSYDSTFFDPLENALQKNIKVPDNVYSKLGFKQQTDHPAVKALRFSGASLNESIEFFNTINLYNIALYLYGKNDSNTTQYKSEINKFLDTYLGRDRFIQTNSPTHRTLTYGCQRKMENNRKLYGISAILAGAAGLTCLYLGNKK